MRLDECKHGLYSPEMFPPFVTFQQTETFYWDVLFVSSLFQDLLGYYLGFSSIRLPISSDQLPVRKQHAHSMRLVCSGCFPALHFAHGPKSLTFGFIFFSI